MDYIKNFGGYLFEKGKAVNTLKCLIKALAYSIVNGMKCTELPRDRKFRYSCLHGETAVLKYI